MQTVNIIGAYAVGVTTMYASHPGASPADVLRGVGG